MSDNQENQSEEAVPSTSHDDLAFQVEEEKRDEHSLKEDELECFRKQWKRELKITPKRKDDAAVNEAAGLTIKAAKHPTENHPQPVTIEEEASSFFRQGIELEQNGKAYEAIQFYRRAVQLVPDIEFRHYETSKQKLKDHADNMVEDDSEKHVVQPDCDSATGSDSESEDGLDLMTRMQKIFNRSCYVCSPLGEQNGTHFSALPMEVVLYILRWVVSSDLDIRSLDLCAEVCRGFYICSRDPEIWRLACARVWGVNCGLALTNYNSWRQMFIERPRIHFIGCYISKTSYVRQGENSFQDKFYKPWHLVEYYRYLRFFPEGIVLMMTSAEDPQCSLDYLKQRTSRNLAIMSGRYRLHDDRIILELKKRDEPIKIVASRYRTRKRENVIPQVLGEQTYNIELQIHNVRSRTHAQLAWLKYAITPYRGGQEVTNILDLPLSRYPPFWFSRVKSYAAESEMPLQ